MRSINFRDRHFNARIDHQIKHVIYGIVHSRSEDFRNDDFRQSLYTLYCELNQHYASERPDYPPAKRTERAAQVFSEFCQNLVYYIAHNANDRSVAKRALECVVAQDLFFYVDHNDQITVWVDPKENYTAFESVVRFGDIEILEKVMDKAAEAAGSRSDLLRDLFLCTDKAGFSVLHTAAYTGNASMVKELLVWAERIFDGRNSRAFHDFLDQPNSRGFTPLNTACYAARKVAHNSGYKNIASLLLSYGADARLVNAYGYSSIRNAPGFWAKDRLFSPDSVMREPDTTYQKP